MLPVLHAVVLSGMFSLATTEALFWLVCGPLSLRAFRLETGKTFDVAMLTTPEGWAQVSLQPLTPSD